MALINQRIHGRILDKKKRFDSYRPLQPVLVRRLKERMAIEYTYNSNAIEGNTLTLQETRLIIEEGVTVEGKSLAETLEAKNHPEAIKFIESLVEADSVVTEETVLQIHKMLMEKIAEDAGRYRIGRVRIAGALFTPPPSSEVKLKIYNLLKWLDENPDEYTPIELAAVFHHRFVQIHPFTEGNGRTARLLMNLILMKNGYPFITAVQNQDRPKYLNTLMKADSGNPSPFVNYIARCVERTLDMYLDAVEEPEILSLSEASKITPYSQEYLSLLARKGAIGAYKQGRKWVITRRDLEKYLGSIATSGKKRGRKKPMKH